MKPIQALFRITLVFTLLFSVAEVNRVGLFVSAKFAGNGCSNILCTCGTSCGCAHTDSETDAQPGTNAGTSQLNSAGIPLLAPSLISADAAQAADCCSGSTEAPDAPDAQSETKLAKGHSAQMCSCGHSDPTQTDGLIKPLDKVTLLSSPEPASPEFRRLCQSFHLLQTHPAFPDEVFHPPVA